MRKLILSALALAVMAFSGEATTNMCVKKSDGTIVRYDVEKVSEVYYNEEVLDPEQGVSVSGKIGNYTYVDLGLPSHLMWATYNVGASKPTEYGGYFAWGETSTKEDYCWETYKWVEKEAYTKYVYGSGYGTIDSLSTLEAADDAATVNWGDGWRMPTSTEIQEMVSGCDWKWTDDFNGSGIAGRIGISKTNGKMIFLPAAGCYYGKTIVNAGSRADYYSSSLYKELSGNALCLDFDESLIMRTDVRRIVGYSVRAVNVIK